MKRILAAALALAALVSATNSHAGRRADIEVLLSQAVLALEYGQAAEALSRVDELTDDEDYGFAAQVIRARALMDLGKTADAKKAFAALENHPGKTDEQWRMSYAVFLRRQGADLATEVLPQLDAALAENSDLGEAHYWKGVFAYEARDCGGALPAFARAIEARVNEAESHYYRGRCYMARRSFGKAREELTLAKEREPEGRLLERIESAEQFLAGKDGAPWWMFWK